MVTAMKGAQMGPPIFDLIPGWVLRPLATVAMKLRRNERTEENKANGDDVTMAKLFPTLHYDFVLVTEFSGRVESLTRFRWRCFFSEVARALLT